MLRTVQFALLATVLSMANTSYATPLTTAAGFGASDVLVTFDEVAVQSATAVTTQYSQYGVTLGADIYAGTPFANPANFAGQFLANGGNNWSYSIFFNAPVSAAGAYWEFNSGVTQILAAYLGGALVESFLYTNADCCESTAFLGFTDITFDEIRLTATGDFADSSFILDNLHFRVGQDAEVPEPASLALLGLGALGMAARRKRKVQLV